MLFGKIPTGSSRFDRVVNVASDGIMALGTHACPAITQPIDPENVIQYKRLT
jgi:hypothetical protein